MERTDLRLSQERIKGKSDPKLSQSSNRRTSRNCQNSGTDHTWILVATNETQYRNIHQSMSYVSNGQTKPTTKKCSLTTKRNTHRTMGHDKYRSYRTIGNVKRQRYVLGNHRSIFKKGLLPPLQHNDHRARSSNVVL